ncbi:MAG TPA: cation:proton antiporter [Planctomycetota bacterium]
MTLLTLLLGLIFLHSLVSGRLERTVFTAPIVFTGVGALVFVLAPQMVAQIRSHDMLLHMAELGLVLLLFTDASRTDLRVLRDIRTLPGRLLSVGMLLTIALGGIAAKLLFPALSWWEAGILAAVLAPTDAGLGQIIVNSKSVPLRIRQTLNVEAGLNDGLSVPFLLFFIAMAGEQEGRGASLLSLVYEQLGLGTLVGLVIGLGGGFLLRFAHRHDWVAHSWRQLGVVVLPLLCLLASDEVGASMFIAAFVAGLAVQVGFPETARHSVEFTEEWGQLFNLSVFFLFGLSAARAWPDFAWPHVIYALLSLTVVRMLPVALALVGAKLSTATVLFVGWFGPRGLASIVLGLVFLEHDVQVSGEATIRLAVIVAVLSSVFAHGASALPGMQVYARCVARLPADAPELTNGTEATVETGPSKTGS